MGSSAPTQASIMLIGDDERLLRVTSWILLEAGYYVWKCASIDEALRSAEELRPAVIIIDLPGDLPANAILPLREPYAGSRIIALHSHDHARPSHVETEGHLHKPFDAEDLLDAVNRVVQQEVGSASAHEHT